MKKTVAIMCALSAAVMLMSCGGSGNHASLKQFSNVSNGLYLFEDQAVEDILITEFDTEKYDLEEYRSLLTAELDEYNKNNPFEPVDRSKNDEEEPDVTVPISIVTLEVKENTFKQQLIYANCNDYLKYNADTVSDRGGSILESGTLKKAPEEILKANIYTKDGGLVDLEALKNGEEPDRYRYFVCDFDAILFGDGDFVGCTETGTYNSKTGGVVAYGGEKVIVLYH